MRNCLVLIWLCLPILSMAQKFPIKEFYNASNNTKLILTYAGKVGVVQNDVLIIDTVYDAMAAYDSVADVVWAKRHLKDYFDNAKLWGAMDKYGAWQLIAKGNKVISDSVFYCPENFVHNIAPASYNDSEVFFINTKGDIISHLRFNKVIRGHDNSYFVMKHAKWGILDAQLAVIANPIYDQISEFAGDYAIASIGDSLFLIHKNGALIRNPLHCLNSRHIDVTQLCDTNQMLFNDGAYEMDEFIENYFYSYHFHNKAVEYRIHNALILEKWRGNSLSFDNKFISRLESREPYIMADESHFPTFEIGPAAEYSNSVVEIHYADSFFISYMSCDIHYLVEQRSFPVANISRSQCHNYFVQADSLVRLGISDVLKPGSDKKMEAVFVQYFNKMDEKEVFESDPVSLYAKVKNDVIFTPLGLWYLVLIRDPELIDSETFETVFIPFNAVAELLKENNPLKRYYKQ